MPGKDPSDKTVRDRGQPQLIERLLDLGRQASKLPVLDPRSADEIIDYDEHGVPR